MLFLVNLKAVKHFVALKRCCIQKKKKIHLLLKVKLNFKIIIVSQEIIAAPLRTKTTHSHSRHCALPHPGTDADTLFGETDTDTCTDNDVLTHPDKDTT